MPPPPAEFWGLLANPGFDRQAMKTVFFFAGNWTYQRHRFYEAAPNRDNTGAFTLHPAKSKQLGWSEKPKHREFAVNSMIGAGANVITMSYWGERGTDRWRFSAPMQTSTFAHDELFDATIDKNVLIMPTIESADASKPKGGQSEAYHFRNDFPGTPDNPAPQLVSQIVDLVNRYLKAPAAPAWGGKWARMYNRSGVPLYAIHIMHVASTLPNRLFSFTSDRRFADGFDAVAAKVTERTGGFRVGFVLDVMPFIVGFFATPSGTGPELRRQSSLLAIQNFIPEVYLNSETDDMGRAEFKRINLQAWMDQGIPVILDVSPGYDAREIFKGSAHWGHSDRWRNALSCHRSPRIKGIVYNSWNGYTEGMVGMPTRQKGTAWLNPPIGGIGSDLGENGDASHLWLRGLFRGDPRTYYYEHFVSGRPLHIVYGAICEKWLALGGERGPLGAPTSSEMSAEVADARRTDFMSGRIYWTSQGGAFEVHGEIFKKYLSMKAAAGDLGLPVSDELSLILGFRRSRFQKGTIYWHPWTGAWVG